MYCTHTAHIFVIHSKRLDCLWFCHLRGSNGVFIISLQASLSHFPQTWPINNLKISLLFKLNIQNDLKSKSILADCKHIILQNQHTSLKSDTSLSPRPLQNYYNNNSNTHVFKPRTEQYKHDNPEYSHWQAGNGSNSRTGVHVNSAKYSVYSINLIKLSFKLVFLCYTRESRFQ